MVRQKSFSETYVETDIVSGKDPSCMIVHPKDTEFEMSLYPNLRSALSSLDRKADDFFDINSGYTLVDVKEFHTPEYGMAISGGSRPNLATVRDVIRIVIYEEGE